MTAKEWDSDAARMQKETVEGIMDDLVDQVGVAAVLSALAEKLKRESAIAHGEERPTDGFRFGRIAREVEELAEEV